ncbi:hypothetical protein EZS27_007517 [termite gut metagenome]|uniref:Uncharacterized protein n=1 Tax=termite gut metagenome TaxID=433724 RepID=A0A5J4SHT0_9ZZZZ
MYAGLHGNSNFLLLSLQKPIALIVYKLCDKNPFIKKVSFSPYYGTGNTSQLTPAQRQSLDSGFKKSSSHFHTLNINPPKNSEILPLPLS